MQMIPEADIEIDATGLRCPEPLMVVRNKLMDMESGQVIRVTATDPSTSWDFQNFCKFLVICTDSKKIVSVNVYNFFK